jgi:hypothetical protein
VERTTGDADLDVASGASLTFTPASWNVPRRVVLAAAVDADSSPDSASFRVFAPGLAPEDVSVSSIDGNTVRLVLSTPSLVVPEGGGATFTVALSKQPTTASVTATVARTAGDADLTVTGGDSLTFTSANWNTPRTVTLAAAQDADSMDGTATVTVALPGQDARTLSVTEADDEPLEPIITSSPVTTARVGTPYVYGVEARSRPTATYSLLSAVPGMAIDAATGVITWTPVSAGTVDVSVTASNGVAPDARQDFSITVMGDAKPDGGQDAGTQEDAGVEPSPNPDAEVGGCGCGAAAVGPLAWLGLSLLVAHLGRRRRG